MSRLDLLAPRIRYNVHDEGGIADFRASGAVLARQATTSAGSAPSRRGRGPRGPLPWADAGATALPLDLRTPRRHDQHHGRQHLPGGRREAVYSDPDVAAVVRSFQLAVVQDEAANPRPGVLLELAEGFAADDAWRAALAGHIRDIVASLSRDYRTSCDEFPAAMLPIVQTFAEGSGPFAGDAERIKQRRIASRLRAPTDPRDGRYSPGDGGPPARRRPHRAGQHVRRVALVADHGRQGAAAGHPRALGGARGRHHARASTRQACPRRPRMASSRSTAVPASSSSASMASPCGASMKAAPDRAAATHRGARGPPGARSTRPGPSPACRTS